MTKLNRKQTLNMLELCKRYYYTLGLNFSDYKKK